MSVIGIVSKEIIAATDEFVRCVRSIPSTEELKKLLSNATRDMGFSYYALVHHTEVQIGRGDIVDIKFYPSAIVERLSSKKYYRRDPVIRGCVFTGGAFLWSDLSQFLQLDRHDRVNLEFGAREGLNQGITVPYHRLGDPIGSCTFAGTRFPDRVDRYLGIAQVIGVFAFQAATRFLPARSAAAASSRLLHPRPRDCVVLAGQGCSNKEIARALALTPRTVDGYLTEARRLFSARDRTELVVSAILAGEIGIDELIRQPE